MRLLVIGGIAAGMSAAARARILAPGRRSGYVFGALGQQLEPFRY